MFKIKRRNIVYEFWVGWKSISGMSSRINTAFLMFSAILRFLEKAVT